MPKCAECRTETDLHELDIPICPACVTMRGRDGPSILDLAAEFVSAREHYRNRMSEFEKRQHLPSGDNIDGELADDVRAAKENYLNALRVYGDALRRDSQ